MSHHLILVDTTTWLGHHEPYFLAYTRVCLELGFKVTALCLGGNKLKDYFPEAISNGSLKLGSTRLPLHQRLFLKLARGLSYLHLIGLSQLQLNALSRWQQIKNLEREDSYVFILDLQGYLCFILVILQKEIILLNRDIIM